MDVDTIVVYVEYLIFAKIAKGDIVSTVLKGVVFVKIGYVMLVQNLTNAQIVGYQFVHAVVQTDCAIHAGRIMIIELVVAIFKP